MVNNLSKTFWSCPFGIDRAMPRYLLTSERLLQLKWKVVFEKGVCLVRYRTVPMNEENDA
jgi:hypothetical protein